ncbi:hypothetical protein MPSEU_000586100 [Mayamaea pseudoterrestris]|nr:hypothetical protein MPSEU_000586100 [Mayamaea pseudoterrestris]
MDFCLQALAHDPVLYNASNDNAASDALVDDSIMMPSLSNGATPQEFDLTRDMDHLLDDCYMFDAIEHERQHAVTLGEQDDAMSIEQSDWQSLSLAYPPILGGFLLKSETPMTLAMPDEQQVPSPASPIHSPIMLHQMPPSSCIVTPTKILKQIVEYSKPNCIKAKQLTTKFKLQQQSPTRTTTQRLAPSKQTSNDNAIIHFKQARHAHAGPESEQMKTVIRMIVYLQEECSSSMTGTPSISDSRHHNVSILHQLRIAINECLEQHLQDNHYFKHLAGSIFELMVEIMERNEWVRVFRASQCMEHVRLEHMGATRQGKLNFETWKKLLWEHETMFVASEHAMAQNAQLHQGTGGKLHKMTMARHKTTRRRGRNRKT